MTGDRRRRMRVILPITALVLATLVVVASSFAYALRDADRLAQERQGSTIRNAISQQGGGLERELRPEVVWGDAYKNTTVMPDRVWMATNYGKYLTHLLGYHEVYVLNANDQPFYGFEGDQSNDGSPYEKDRSAIADLISEIRAPDLVFNKDVSSTLVDLGQGIKVEQRSISDVRLIAGAPSTVVVETIVPDSADTAVGPVTPQNAALLVATFPIDQGVLRSYGETFGFSDVLWTNGAAVEPGHASTLVRSYDGSIVGRLSWVAAMPGAEVLQDMIGGAVAALALLAALGVYVFADIREAAGHLIRKEHEEARRARTDFLTGLPNRLALSEETESRVAALSSHSVLAMVIIGPDGFKHINDSLGNQAGDTALIAIGRRLTEVCPDAFVARIGGDEFALLLEAPEAEALPERAEAIADALGLPLPLEDALNVPLSCSVGYAVAPADGRTQSQLLRRADLALFRSKKEARGRAHAFAAEMETSADRRVAVEAALRRALAAERIEVEFQPLMSNDGRSVRGVEALARWRDADLGEVTPGEFIAIAEQTGLIVQLGEQVLRKSMLAARPWTDISLAVNVSAQQIQRTDMVATVTRLLRECDFPARRLEIELTESILVTDEARADIQMKGLQNLGVKLALDDFGTGYASLLYLRQFGFDKLKIDRNFVKDVDTSIQSKAMVISITSMSRALGLDVTAEGVENAAQREFLSVAGCDRLQGFHFSAAIPAERLSQFLHAHEAAAA